MTPRMYLITKSQKVILSSNPPREEHKDITWTLKRIKPKKNKVYVQLSNKETAITDSMYKAVMLLKDLEEKDE